MKKILSILMLLVAIVTGAWASTVNDLATISSDYTFISDNVTSSGTAVLTGGTLYDSNKILSVGGNNVATNKESSTFGDATHLNSLRIKGDQNQLAFKVAGACTITFYQQSHSSRKLQAGTSSYSNNLGSGGTSTTSWTLDLSSLTGSTVIYLSSTDPSNNNPKQADLYIAGFVVTMIAAPTITAVDAASIKATTSGVDATTNIDIQGSNLTGSTLTATLSPEVEGLSVGLVSSAITAGAISTTATLTYNRTANVKQGTTTLTISDGTTSKEIAVTYSAYITPWTLQSISESTTWTFDDSNITSGSIKKNTSAIYANIEGMAFGNDFDATALEIDDATWPYYSDAHIAQAKSFKFNTTVPGTVKVTYNKAGNDPVYISVNGGDNGSASSTTTTDAIVVSPGNVTIAGYGEAEHTTEALMNVSKIEFTAAVVPTSIALNKSATAIEVGGSETLTVTATPDGASNLVTWASSDDAIATVSDAGLVTAVAEGEATITATSIFDNTVKATCTVTVEAAQTPIVTLPTEEREGYSQTGDVSNYSRDNHPFNGTSVITIPNGGTITVTVPFTTTVSKIVVTGSSDDNSNSSTVTINGANDEESDAVAFPNRKAGSVASVTFVPTTQTTTYTITSANKSSVVKVAIYGEEAPTTATIGKGGFSTFAGKYNYTISGAKALAAQNKNTSVGFTEIPSTTIIPANTGVVLQGTEGDEVTITYTTADAGTVTTDMVGVTAANPFVASSNVYVIATKAAGTKFYKYTGSTFPVGKAYLNAAVNAGDALDIVFDGATAVEAIAEANANSAAPVKVIKNGKLYIGNYNVAGQQVK